jgi:hypothetical protein
MFTSKTLLLVLFSSVVARTEAWSTVGWGCCNPQSSRRQIVGRLLSTNDDLLLPDDDDLPSPPPIQGSDPNLLETPRLPTMANSDYYMRAMGTSPRRILLAGLSATTIALAGNLFGITSQLLTVFPEDTVEATGLDTYFPRGKNATRKYLCSHVIPTHISFPFFKRRVQAMPRRRIYIFIPNRMGSRHVRSTRQGSASSKVVGLQNHTQWWSCVSNDASRRRCVLILSYEIVLCSNDADI